MAKYLKRGASQASRQSRDTQVRDTVERILADVQERGDSAVRELSTRFDGWDRES